MAILFDDAQTEYLSHAVAVQISFPVSMGAWFRTDDDSHDGQVIGLYAAGAAGNSVELVAFGSIDDTLRARIRKAGAGSHISASSGAAFVQDTWHHGMMVCPDADNVAVYLDGGNKGTASGVTGCVAGSFDVTRIGYQGDSDPLYPFSGDIGEAAAWAWALSDAEVAAVGAGWPPWTIRPNQLAAYWPLNSITFLKDIRSTYHMTAYNAPVTSTDHPPILHPGTGIWTPPPLAAVAGGNPWNYYAQVG